MGLISVNTIVKPLDFSRDPEHGARPRGGEKRAKIGSAGGARRRRERAELSRRTREEKGKGPLAEARHVGGLCGPRPKKRSLEKGREAIR